MVNIAIHSGVCSLILEEDDDGDVAIHAQRFNVGVALLYMSSVEFDQFVDACVRRRDLKIGTPPGLEGA